MTDHFGQSYSAMMVQQAVYAPVQCLWAVVPVPVPVVCGAQQPTTQHQLCYGNGSEKEDSASGTSSSADSDETNILTERFSSISLEISTDEKISNSDSGSTKTTETHQIIEQQITDEPCNENEVDIMRLKRKANDKGFRLGNIKPKVEV
jgi:hypothetical protein